MCTHFQGAPCRLKILSRYFVALLHCFELHHLHHTMVLRSAYHY
jgi:hypothetical protein